MDVRNVELVSTVRFHVSQEENKETGGHILGLVLLANGVPPFLPPFPWKAPGPSLRVYTGQRDEWPEDAHGETVTATDTAQFESVSASRVIETRSLPS